MTDKTHTGRIVLLATMPWVVLVALGMCGGFYWFLYRPAQARAICEREAIHQAQSDFKEMVGKGTSEGWFITGSKEAAYKSCMRKHGLEPDANRLEATISR